MRLTEHFDSSEFVVSDTFPALAANVVLNEFDRYKLFLLCATILEPLRIELGPIQILSGKRDEALNSAVGGAKASHHLFNGWSCAADFAFSEPLTSPRKFSKLGIAYERLTGDRKFSLGECFLYKTKDGLDRFIHVALPTQKDLWQYGVKQEGSSKK